jgi:hypothetical protein
MQVYGSPRFTKDVDFILDREPDSLSPLRKIRPIGFGGESCISPGGAKVDLIVRTDDFKALFDDAIANAVLTDDDIPIVSVEHLAALKLVAKRENDISDLKWLIRQPGLLHLKSARAIIYRFLGKFAQNHFDDVVDQAHVEKEMMNRRGIDPEEE